MKTFLALGLLLAGVAATPSYAQVVDKNGVVSLKLSGAPVTLDYAHAQPIPMPKVKKSPGTQLQMMMSAPDLAASGQPSGTSPGAVGSGKENPTSVPMRQAVPSSGDAVPVPQQYGSNNQPFTTANVNPVGLDAKAHKGYPFRAAGQLTFKKPNDTRTWYCSASLIKPGIIVTAAHCVANYGQKQTYSGWTFIPAFNKGAAPYGVWYANYLYLPSAYYNGTDGCAVYGVVCPDDVAVLGMAPQSGAYVGNTTGWLGYAYGGYGYNGSGQALISQLGYPLKLDGGLKIERTDSQGSVSSTYNNNTVIGSLQTGGSSGGPFVINLGIAPQLSGTAVANGYADNRVVGVTSWGYDESNDGIKQQGASPFTAGNIQSLINSICASTADAAAC